MNRYLFFLAALFVCGACSGPEKHLKKGDQSWAIGEFYEASLEYAKAYAKTKPTQKEQRGAIAYKVAESNRRMNYVAKALAAYKNAVRYHYTDTLTYLHLGHMQLASRDYKGAAESFQNYLALFPQDPSALLGLQSCAAAPVLREQGSAYTVREDRTFNANYDDYSPALGSDLILFSSTRRDATGDELSGITGMKNGDIFFSQKDDKGKWKRPEPLPDGVNSQYDEGAPCLSPDGKTLYFTRCRWDSQYPRMSEIYQSSRSDATWGKATLCEIANDTLSNFAHPAVSPDGQYLYFVSDMPGGLGGTDIWRVPITSHGFGAVENLGAPVNTSGDERFPTFRPNGDLYYSSDGKVGMGGLDIYCARFDSTNSQWHIEHLPYPVNSHGDDFGMTFDGPYNRGYFSSNRANRRGWDNIYTFECPEIVLTATGWVYEQDGYELPQAVVYMIGDDGTNEKVSVGLDGSFSKTIKPNVRYLFLATCEGYLNYRQMLSLPEQNASLDTVMQFPLPSVSIPVLVRNVFYDFNKPDFLPSSLPALNKLVELLKHNPSIAIELSSHCDYRGSEAYNERLSQHRAESVVKYLTSQGISPKRVIARGYGKLRPKVITKKFAEQYPFLHAGDTLTEAFIKRLPEAQQDTCNALNRRTEFSVLQTTYGLFDENGNLIPEALASKAATADTAATIPALPQIPMPPAAQPAGTSIPAAQPLSPKASSSQSPSKDSLQIPRPVRPQTPLRRDAAPNGNLPAAKENNPASSASAAAASAASADAAAANTPLTKDELKAIQQQAKAQEKAQKKAAKEAQKQAKQSQTSTPQNDSGSSSGTAL